MRSAGKINARFKGDPALVILYHARLDLFRTDEGDGIKEGYVWVPSPMKIPESGPVLDQNQRYWVLRIEEKGESARYRRGDPASIEENKIPTTWSSFRIFNLIMGSFMDRFEESMRSHSIKPAERMYEAVPEYSKRLFIPVASSVGLLSSPVQSSTSCSDFQDEPPSDVCTKDLEPRIGL